MENTYVSQNISSVEESYDELVDDSNYLTQNSDYSSSNDVLHNLVKLFGCNSELSYKIANNYYYMNDCKNAITYYEKVLETDNQFCGITHLLLAKCNKNLNDIDKAIDLLEYALNYYPTLDRNSLLLELGWCYFDSRKYDLANSIFKSLLFYSPTYTQICKYYISLIETFEENFIEAIICLKDIIKTHYTLNQDSDIGTGIFSYHYDLASLYMKVNDYSSALNEYEKAHEIDCSHQGCLFALIEVNKEHGCLENAIYYELLLIQEIKDELKSSNSNLNIVNSEKIDLHEVIKKEDILDDYPFTEDHCLSSIELPNENNSIFNSINKYFNYFIKVLRGQ